MAARKVQKADREKLRRDRLNEQFLELGSALDPDRPKNDKATILSDTIQMLKDLMAQVNKLKSEYESLSEESSECPVPTEAQSCVPLGCNGRIGGHGSSSALPISHAGLHPSGPMAVHPSLQPYPFFHGGQTHGSMPNPFMSYPNPCNLHAEQPSSALRPHNPQPGSNRSHGSGKNDAGGKLPDRQCRSSAEKGDSFSDVATELELKTPGSALPVSKLPSRGQDAKAKKGEMWQSPKKSGGAAGEATSSSRCSSSVQDSSSSNGDYGSVAEE
ncbi:unnamed protein product [Spirodela intermedia]|uniref:BHLH domain-containing protein n=1 Tax=Spirodela intermedia TaxID=51605 RepID=A0A7I8IYZ2_SPIIN|nr:unnamed protein product [Spirodela intermedia]CAA6663205.1 unnamed protein product [Spirodela intermedia]